MKTKDNGVIPEQYDSAAIATMQPRAEVVPCGLWRKKSGTWTITLNMGLDLTLPDGRQVTFSRVVNLSHGQGTSKKHHRKPKRENQ
jgi:hypothetical protein